MAGNFSLQASGFLIENGKLTRPVTLIVADGNFLEILNHVEFVGSDFKLNRGGYGTPSIKISGLVVSEI